MNGALVRTMNSVPSVVMKDGMPNLSVIRPLARPISAAIAKPIRIATGSGMSAA